MPDGVTLRTSPDSPGPAARTCCPTTLASDTPAVSRAITALTVGQEPRADSSTRR